MTTAASRWRKLLQHRSVYLDRAIQASSLTIPSLIPDSDGNSNVTNSSNYLPSLYQGAGARGVNGLSAKLLLALYPPQQPFFRLTLDKRALEQYLNTRQIEAQRVQSEVDEKLSMFERSILRKLDKLQARSALFEAIKHLVVSGNGLLYAGQDGVRFYSLRSYVIDRDPEGNVKEIVIREEISEEFLPESVRKSSGDDEGSTDHTCELYTHVELSMEEDRIEWYQEYEGKVIPGSRGFSRPERSPWIPLRLHRIAGESYGRGIVEEVIGDLATLEALSKAIVQGNLINAKTIFLVNPNGITRADVLNRADNGDFVPGNPEDVSPLETNKARDFGVALQTMQMIERRLQFVFMANEAIQRDAERVTAEEIRLMAEQLEQAQGGLYTVLSEELQLPLIRRTIHLMERDGELPDLPEEFVEPQITTGLDAIGRGNDRARLTQFLGTIAQALGPEQFIRYVNPSELIKRFAASDGIDTAGLVKTDEELQAEEQQAQQLQLQMMQAEAATRNGNSANQPVQQAGAQGGG